ncbi:hypothetical protein VPMG_00113 [Vibrio phage VBP32]|uniref:Uncharacterized protein n=2 Tax=Stoningtonvirus VBP47 TaxID=2846606 RepID=M4SP13_9CAUD|nr:hypothetical protein VPNG_00016 [Vibrio phage VBP47]YP_007676603.1 hypothetical protein VPMG_00113 [Vibrio phage VBP32]AGH57040.1 hypothetical protein VPNG_00016 [Vibrio phage VBP47]AGH57252.1 hypothetical protein VPMG_00113 [Vibrio phage VBP32]
MNFKMLMAGILWFQTRLINFVEKSEKQNEADAEKMAGIQAKVDQRKSEMRKAKVINKNIDKMFEEDEEEADETPSGTA